MNNKYITPIGGIRDIKHLVVHIVDICKLEMLKSAHLNVIRLLENKPYPDRKNILFHPLHKSSCRKFHAFTTTKLSDFNQYIVKDTSFTACFTCEACEVCGIPP